MKKALRPVLYSSCILFIFAAVYCTGSDSRQSESNYGQSYLDSLNSARLNQMEFRRFDKDRDRLVSRQEFNNLTRAMLQVHSDDPAQFQRGRFDSLDSNADENLSLREFRFNYVRDTLPWPGISHTKVVYKTVEDEPLLLDILMPTKRVYDRAPVLYFIHGGGFRSGAKEYLRLNDLRMETALQFADEGFCCVSVSYRLVNHDRGQDPVLIPDCLTDAWDGLRFLHNTAEKYHINPDRIIVWGESAGGHISQMLSFSDPEKFPGIPVPAGKDVRPLAGISWYGPSDFTGSLKDEVGNSLQNRHFRNITGKHSFSEEDMELLRDMSPLYQLDKSDPPLLLMQGDSDHAVHISHATHLNARAQELGAKVEFILVQNAGHNWRQVGEPIDPSKEELLEIMVDFAQRMIKSDQ